MRYKLLGRSGLRVSELCLGAMTFGEDWEASKIELGFPHDFLVQGRQYVFGETFPLIDDHRA